jgi:hypothetical protein
MSEFRLCRRAVWHGSARQQRLLLPNGGGGAALYGLGTKKAVRFETRRPKTACRQHRSQSQAVRLREVRRPRKVDSFCTPGGGGAGRVAGTGENAGGLPTKDCHGAWQEMAGWQGWDACPLRRVPSGGVFFAGAGIGGFVDSGPEMPMPSAFMRSTWVWTPVDSVRLVFRPLLRPLRRASGGEEGTRCEATGRRGGACFTEDVREEKPMTHLSSPHCVGGEDV